ncbi:MAG: hypothetical protein JRH01_07705 [Deltaproteobacteria bacterium]|nr:hypothetical protein [Deltaproteobacteria bacterium]MBW2395458.1 hypothetical protein [Deltaproteobacteria bacterium]
MLWMAASPAGAEALTAQLVDGRRDATAVAWDSVRGELVLGRDDGAWLGSPPGGEPPVPVLHRGAVFDLRVDGAGQLWVATERGLFLRRADGVWQEQQLGAGASREVRRLVAGPGGTIACATAAGAFLRHPDGVWRRLDGALPHEDVTALAFRADGGAVWLVSAGDLHAARLEDFVAHDVRRLPLPEGREAVLDLLASEATLLVLTERRLLHLDAVGRFEVERLPLAPGASASRLALAHGRLWVATDRGLLGHAPGGWERAPGGLANAGVVALAGGPDQLLTAGERGVHRLVPAVAAPTSRQARLPAGPSPWEGEPGIAAVRLAALRYLELDRGPIRSMAARARARGWLPEVELRGGYGGLRRRTADWDQTFSSGEDRLFFDREQRRERDFAVQAVLRWDLGDTVYHAEELDVAKERREVIELRDEVLDELQQIFFERRRVLLTLATQPDPREPEAERLRLRAAELAAGLDAWTGGWWSSASLVSPRNESEILP